MRIILVDDDPIVCQSLQTIIDLSARQEGLEDVRVVASGRSGEEAIALYRQEKPDILLLDIQMSGMDGLSAAKTILQEDPSARILFLTTFLDEAYILEALRLGAKGYLMKSAASNILPALLAVTAGQRVYGDEIVDQLPHLLVADSNRLNPPDEEAARQVSSFASLSDSEWALVKLVAQGQNNRELAQNLHFSEGTVRNYLSQILEKLGLRDRTQLAVQYYKEGFH